MLQRPTKRPNIQAPTQSTLSKPKPQASVVLGTEYLPKLEKPIDFEKELDVVYQIKGIDNSPPK